MHRNNLILLVLAVVQGLVLCGLVFFRDTEKSVAADGGKLAGISAESLVEIAIQGEGDAPELVMKRGDGDAWSFASANAYPVDATKIEALIGKLTKVDLGRPVIRSAENHGPVKVADDDFRRRLRLKTKDGKSTTVYLAAGSRGRSSYLRRGGEDEVYETEAIETWDARETLAAWASSEPLTFDAASIRSFELVAGENTFAFEKRSVVGAEATGDESEEATTPEEEWWLTKPEESKVKGDAAQTLLDDLANLKPEAVLGVEKPADRGFDQPEGTLTLRPADGDPIVLIFGTKSEKANRRAFKDSRVRWYLDVPNWTISTMLEKTLDDFREKPEESKPGEESPEDG